MDRAALLSQYTSDQSRANYRKAWRHWDAWLGTQGKTEAAYVAWLGEQPRADRYASLQAFVAYLGGLVSPRTVKDYFDRIFKWLVLLDADLDYSAKRIRLRLPRVPMRRFAGLDHSMIATELRHCTPRFGLYLRVLAGSGMRETEALRLTPGMVRFDEVPCRLELPVEITKFNCARESYLPPHTAEMLRQRVADKDKGPDDPILIRRYSAYSLIEAEKEYARVRAAAGFETPNRKKYQQHDITLHSHRAYYITACTYAGVASFGHATAGHSKNLSVYYRMSPAVRRQTYADIAETVDWA